MSELSQALTGLYNISLKLKNKIEQVHLTAFEVFPTSTTIPSGTPFNDASIPAGLRANVPSAYASETLRADIPANATMGFRFRASQPIAQSDIIIDWGDGSAVSKVATAGTFDGTYMNIEHTYTTLDKAYTVKIMGSKYYYLGFIHGKSIISKALTDDLPLAENITSMYEPLFGDRLFDLNIDKYGTNVLRLNNMINLGNMFSCCYNLLRVKGFEFVKPSGLQRTFSGFFQNCYNLRSCDLVFPDIGDGSDMFGNARNLTGEVTKLFSADRYTNRAITITNMFAPSVPSNLTTYYANLTCDTAKLAKILWENTDVTWTASGAFCGLKTQYRKNIPTSFGGCAAATVIQKEVATYEDLPAKTAAVIGQVYKVTSTGKYYQYQYGLTDWYDCSDFVVTAADVASSAELQARLVNGYYKTAIKHDLDVLKEEVVDLIPEINGSTTVLVESDSEDASVKTLSVKVSAEDKLISLAEDGLKSVIDLEKITSGLSESEVATRYVLKDKNGNQIGSAIDIFKDQFLEDVYYRASDNKLVFVFILSTGERKEVAVALPEMPQYGARNGVKKVQNASDSLPFFEGSLDAATEAFLTLGKDGFKLSGVGAAISAAIASVDFGSLIDKIDFYPDQTVTDISYMVETGVYFVSTAAGNEGFPEGVTEGCVAVLKNGQLLISGAGDLAGRVFYRHEDGVQEVTTQYTGAWSSDVAKEEARALAVEAGLLEAIQAVDAKIEDLGQNVVRKVTTSQQTISSEVRVSDIKKVNDEYFIKDFAGVNQGDNDHYSLCQSNEYIFLHNKKSLTEVIGEKTCSYPQILYANIHDDLTDAKAWHTVSFHKVNVDSANTELTWKRSGQYSNGTIRTMFAAENGRVFVGQDSADVAYQLVKDTKGGFEAKLICGQPDSSVIAEYPTKWNPSYSFVGAKANGIMYYFCGAAQSRLHIFKEGADGVIQMVKRFDYQLDPIVITKPGGGTWQNGNCFNGMYVIDGYLYMIASLDGIFRVKLDKITPDYNFNNFCRDMECVVDMAAHTELPANSVWCMTVVGNRMYVGSATGNGLYIATITDGVVGTFAPVVVTYEEQTLNYGRVTGGICGLNGAVYAATNVGVLVSTDGLTFTVADKTDSLIRKLVPVKVKDAEYLIYSGVFGFKAIGGKLVADESVYTSVRDVLNIVSSKADKVTASKGVKLTPENDIQLDYSQNGSFDVSDSESETLAQLDGNTLVFNNAGVKKAINYAIGKYDGELEDIKTRIAALQASLNW